MIGPERSKETMETQTLARGMVSSNLETGVQAAPSSKPFQPWQSQSYADPLLSSAEFASKMMDDCHAALDSFGSHTCRSDVCHNGRLGDIGFCRMMFWHRYVVTKKGSAPPDAVMGYSCRSDGMVQAFLRSNEHLRIRVLHPFGPRILSP